MFIQSTCVIYCFCYLSTLSSIFIICLGQLLFLLLFLLSISTIYFFCGLFFNIYSTIYLLLLLNIVKLSIYYMVTDILFIFIHHLFILSTVSSFYFLYLAIFYLSSVYLFIFPFSPSLRIFFRFMLFARLALQRRTYR